MVDNVLFFGKQETLTYRREWSFCNVFLRFVFFPAETLQLTIGLGKISRRYIFRLQGCSLLHLI